MNILSVDLIWLAFIIFTISFFFILIMKGNERFWLPNIVIWLALLFSLIMVNAFTSNEVSYLELQQQQKPVTNKEGEIIPSYELENANKQRTSSNNKLLNLLGIHSAFSFLWMLLGYRKTAMDYYKKSAITFAFITIIYLVIIILF